MTSENSLSSGMSSTATSGKSQKPMARFGRVGTAKSKRAMMLETVLRSELQVLNNFSPSFACRGSPASSPASSTAVLSDASSAVSSVLLSPVLPTQASNIDCDIPALLLVVIIVMNDLSVD